MAAYRAGVKTVFIPKANERDLAELDKTVLANIKFVTAENVETVINGALALPKSEEEAYIPVTEFNKTAAAISQ